MGDRFLYKMVRSLVGHLVHVGLGKADADDIHGVLAAGDRRAAAESAPPQGLFLARVFFEDAAWSDYNPVLPPFRWDPAG